MNAESTIIYFVNLFYLTITIIRYEIECENQKRKTQEKLNPLRREHEDLEEQVRGNIVKLTLLINNVN
jgi:hypothetical protein